MEGDEHGSASAQPTSHFNPLPPHGGRLFIISFSLSLNVFQSTPSAWRETKSQRKHPGNRSFQSTPSAWRETRPPCPDRVVSKISIHSLRMEGDHRRSIHVSWHCYFNPLPPHGGRPNPCFNLSVSPVFQSTPSAWRETRTALLYELMYHISIHSLRMEGDDCGASVQIFQHISIHSLRMEGDRTEWSLKKCVVISIHSLRMEGDPPGWYLDG